MDFKDRERRHSLKVIISEVLMVIAVVATVAVLALIVSGYWLGSDLKVERNGMLQISSQPTGATVEIDGVTSSWLERTNTSKVLTSGEHSITLTKDGYDSWSRTINITEGLLYRIHYPRLFPTGRTPESIYDASITTLATVSPDGNYMLLANNTTDWTLLSLESNNLDPKKLNISTIFDSVSLADGATTGLFTGTILGADWSEDNTHILFKVKGDTATEWVILNPKDLKNSVNLTREFAVDFSQIEMLDSSASTLLAVKSGNLHKIDVSSRQVSAILVENIANFDHYGSEVVFSAKNTTSSGIGTDKDTTSSVDTISSVPTADNTTTSSAQPYYVGTLKIGENKITPLKQFSTTVKVVISKFYDDKYITILEENTVTLYQKEEVSPVFSSEITFTPEKIKVGHAGEFIEMTSGTQFATLDMEAQSVREWAIDSEHYGWLDRDMLYSVADGQLVVYDFDGLNRRVLSRKASERFPAAITGDKWLYYFSDGSLIREDIK